MLRLVYLSLIFVFLCFYSGLSITFYVNGVKGNDTLDGRSEKNAFKTIQRAVDKAQADDIIIIEGANGKDKIFYRENVVIPSDKNGLKLQGRNRPIITQKEKIIKDNFGLIINSDIVEIRGIDFKNILGGEISSLNLPGGCGIVINSGISNVTITDVEIENCNWGIIIYEAEVNRIFNNKIEKIKKCETDENSGGVGIFIFTKTKYLQSNQIGIDGPNSISNCERFGIFLGSYDGIAFADLSVINNNKLINNEIGLGLFNTEGIISIAGNYFEGNNVSLYIEGDNLDVSIERNVFKNALSKYEVKAKNYDGNLLYNIWKSNENVFGANTCAIIQKDFNTILSIDGFKFISNDQNFIKQFLNEEGKLDLYEYTR